MKTLSPAPPPDVATEPRFPLLATLFVLLLMLLLPVLIYHLYPFGGEKPVTSFPASASSTSTFTSSPAHRPDADASINPSPQLKFSQKEANPMSEPLQLALDALPPLVRESLSDASSRASSAAWTKHLESLRSQQETQLKQYAEQVKKALQARLSDPNNDELFTLLENLPEKATPFIEVDAALKSLRSTQHSDGELTPDTLRTVSEQVKAAKKQVEQLQKNYQPQLEQLKSLNFNSLLVRPLIKLKGPQIIDQILQQVLEGRF